MMTRTIGSPATAAREQRPQAQSQTEPTSSKGPEDTVDVDWEEVWMDEIQEYQECVLSEALPFTATGRECAIGLPDALTEALAAVEAAQAPPEPASSESAVDRSGPETRSPFGDRYQSTSDVSVDAWGTGARNDCFERILRNQGFSLEEIYANDGELIDLVGQANGLVATGDPNNPYTLHPGMQLVVPQNRVNP